jgi:hypothetical protein
MSSSWLKNLREGIGTNTKISRRRRSESLWKWGYHTQNKTTKN